MSSVENLRCFEGLWIGIHPGPGTNVAYIKSRVRRIERIQMPDHWTDGQDRLCIVGLVGPWLAVAPRTQ